MTCNPLHGVKKPGSVGLPLPGLQIEIVDEELRLKGDTVMLGYWRNPEATANVLRDGWLYTRDLGYQDSDGYIYILGRRDDLINIGGAKVYPQEVENVLYRHPSIAACAVKGEVSELYHQVVVAYVVLHPERDVTVQELQKFCRHSLADYKIPNAINFVTEIPKNPAGKILRHQLKNGAT
jgi:long-chain acyl-CoA synthetase